MVHQSYGQHMLYCPNGMSSQTTRLDNQSQIAGGAEQILN